VAECARKIERSRAFDALEYWGAVTLGGFLGDFDNFDTFDGCHDPAGLSH
jgi:hypothetical protein